MLSQAQTVLRDFAHIGERLLSRPFCLESHNRHMPILKMFKAEVMFEYANNNERLLSISDRLDIFQTVIPILSSDYHLPNVVCPADFKQYYIDMVNVYRNRLGHITFGEKTIRIKGKDVEINQDLHRLLRKNIAEVDSTIRKIEEYISLNM